MNLAITGIVHEPAFPWAAWTLGPLLVIGLIAAFGWVWNNPKQARKDFLEVVLPIIGVTALAVGIVSLIIALIQYWV